MAFPGEFPDFKPLAFGGLNQEREMQAALEQYIATVLDDSPEHYMPPDSTDEKLYVLSPIDKYLDTEYFDDKKMRFYLLSETGSLFNVSEPFGEDLYNWNMRHENRILLLEIRLSMLLHRVRLS